MECRVDVQQTIADFFFSLAEPDVWRGLRLLGWSQAKQESQLGDIWKSGVSDSVSH